MRKKGSTASRLATFGGPLISLPPEPNLLRIRLLSCGTRLVSRIISLAPTRGHALTVLSGAQPWCSPKFVIIVNGCSERGMTWC
jgi:hypothetical protein